MEVLEKEDVEVLSSEVALLAITKGEMDMQIATAKQYPRSLKAFLATATELVTMDEDSASSMWYSLPPRKGGDGSRIEGPSVRMAEVVAYAWTNLRAETNIESIDEKYVTAVGTVMDIERNVAFRQRVKKRITTKDNKRYGEDMIVNTCNSASSVAFREAVFKAIPRVFVKQLLERARGVAIGTAETLVARRAKALGWFATQGAEEKMVLTLLGVRSVEEITLDHLLTLSEIRTAIREGADINEIFEIGKTTAKEEAKGMTARVKERKENKAPATSSATLPNFDTMTEDEKDAIRREP